MDAIDGIGGGGGRSRSRPRYVLTLRGPPLSAPPLPPPVSSPRSLSPRVGPSGLWRELGGRQGGREILSWARGRRDENGAKAAISNCIRTIFPTREGRSPARPPGAASMTSPSFLICFAYGKENCRANLDGLTSRMENGISMTGK